MSSRHHTQTHHISTVDCMKRPHDDRKAVGTTAKRPKLVSCSTTRPPPSRSILPGELTGSRDDRKAVGTTAKWPKLVGCSTTRPPPSWSILPEELTVEILLRLPVRSLVKFRSVCRSWRALISSSQFAKGHLQRSIADPTLNHPRFAYFNCIRSKSTFRKIGVFSMQSLFENPSAPTKVVCFGVGRGFYHILGSSNGLLCLFELLPDTVDSRARLWNPCTGLASEWLEIRGFPTYRGFGYDHVHDKYKLFGVVRLKSGETAAKICTLGENSWRTIQDFPFRTNEQTGIFVSGTLNWIAMQTKHGDSVILSLDLGKETYDQLSLPDHRVDGIFDYAPVLGVLRNCLALCFDHKNTHWAVWLMKEYGVQQSWTKLAMIPHHAQLHNFRQFNSLVPLHISENDVLLARAPSSKLVLCNLNDGRLDFPMIDSSSDGTLELPMSERLGTRVLRIYRESLVSPSHCGLRICLSEMSLIKPSL